MKQGMAKVKGLIASALREQNHKGYRENLGYDSENKLHNFLEFCDDLTYADKAGLYTEFYKLCDTI